MEKYTSVIEKFVILTLKNCRRPDYSADDVRQELTLCVWQALLRYRGGTMSEMTWVYTQCQRVYKNAIRRTARRGRVYQTISLSCDDDDLEIPAKTDWSESDNSLTLHILGRMIPARYQAVYRALRINGSRERAMQAGYSEYSVDRVLNILKSLGKKYTPKMAHVTNI